MFEAENTKFVLASSSPTRAKLLENTGLSFEISPPKIDESAIKQALQTDAIEPADLAELLAETKATEVAKHHPSAISIGADQILALEKEIFSKPNTKEEAYTTLFKLRGKTHQLISAIVLVKDEEVIWRYSSTAELTMRDFSPEFLGNYIAHCGDGIFSSAGAYQLEFFGIHLFEEIKGDYFTILGFPIVSLLKTLREKGYIQK